MIVEVLLVHLESSGYETGLIFLFCLGATPLEPRDEYFGRWRKEENRDHLMSPFFEKRLDMDHSLWFDDVDRMFPSFEYTVELTIGRPVVVRMDESILDHLIMFYLRFEYLPSHEVIVDTVHFFLSPLSRGRRDNFLDFMFT
jgi:hypothetical protein